MSKFAVILPAAGRSARFGDPRRKKPFIELKGRPVWVRAIEPFVNHEAFGQAIVVVPAEELDWFKEKFRANLAFMNVELVAGGAERADSVQNALAHVRADMDYVAIHDAARPLIVKQWLDAVLKEAKTSGAAIPAIRISSTVKRVDQGQITETVSRDGLWAAQTPQIFSRELLLEAFARRDGFPATDEAQLVERIGQTVSLVEGSAMNIKITTQEDFKMAEALLSVLPAERTAGSLHPFAADNPHLFS